LYERKQKRVQQQFALCEHQNDKPPLSWKTLLDGYLPDYLYELGRLDNTRPFAELERISRVNDRSHAAGEDAAFLRRIREGLPNPRVMP